MKRLLPLLLLGVTAMFFSCESYDKNEGKWNLPTVTFATVQEDLPFMGQITAKIVLDKPAESDLVIPFTLSNKTMENRYFEFIGLPPGNTDEERHYVTIAAGQTEASITLKHLKVNATEAQFKIYLSRSSDDSYQLGNNKQLLVRIAEREKVFVTFTAKEYLTREYSNIEVNFKLRGEVTGDEYTAPEDLTLNLRIVPTATTTYEPEITNTPSRAWQFEEGSSVEIEEGMNEGSKVIRIRCVNTTIPSAPNDAQPIFERKDDWPEGYYYRFGLTFQNLPSGFELGEPTDTEADTAYVYIKRIEDPIAEILLPHKWVNIEFGVDEDYGIDGRNRYKAMFSVSGDQCWDSLPRHKSSFEDGMYFTKTEGTAPDGSDEYFVHVVGDSTNPDLSKRSGFLQFFRSGRIRFNKYETLNMFAVPLGSGTPSCSMRFPGNRNFNWEEPAKVAWVTPPQEGEDMENNGAAIFVVPSSVYGDTEETFVDIVILQGSWDRVPGNFLWTSYNYKDPTTGNKVFGDNRRWDIWYRLYRDTREDLNP